VLAQMRAGGPLSCLVCHGFGVIEGRSFTLRGSEGAFALCNRALVFIRA
jgi:hypothetical protein